MSRSIKKGPFIDFKLGKRVLEMNEGQKKSVIKTCQEDQLSRQILSDIL